MMVGACDVQEKLNYAVGMLWMLLIGCSMRMRFPGSLEGLEGYTGGAPGERPRPVMEPLPPPSPDEAQSLEAVLSARSRPTVADDVADEVVFSSRGLVDQTTMVVEDTVYRHDCIGFVEAAYAAVDMDLTSSIAHLHAQAQVLGIFHRDPYPHPGDVVFFDNSYDKNRNGVRDDPLTHVAVVESVDADGTIQMIHLGGRRKPVTRKPMNLLHPDRTRSEDGKVWNGHLRSTQDRDGGPTLASALWVGFGSFWLVTEEELREATEWIEQQSSPQ